MTTLGCVNPHNLVGRVNPLEILSGMKAALAAGAGGTVLVQG